MAKTSGTAATHVEFMTAFEAFLNTIGWTQMGASGQFKCYRAPGAASSGEFFFYFRMTVDAAANCYTLEMRGASGFDAGQVVGAQEGVSPPTYLNLWPNEIKYWFYGNGRRIALVAKCNTFYLSAYAGLLIPFAMPDENLKPFYMAGNYYKTAPYNAFDAASRFIVDPGYGSAFYFNQASGGWISVFNHNTDANADVNFVGGGELMGYVWPHRVQTVLAGGLQWSAEGLRSFRPTLDTGEMPSFAAHVMDAERRVVVGVLDGVYSSAGFNRASEQVLTESAIDYRIFQNIGRITGRDFMAIKEI